MIRISDSEKKYILQGIAADIRGDGRKRTDTRRMVLETGLLPQSNGSARIALASSNTDVLVSTKVEIGVPRESAPDEGWMEINVTCCPSVSAKLGGRTAEEMTTELSQLMARLLASGNGLDTKALCLIPSKVAWIVYVDVTVFDTGGNLPDTIAAGVYAALHDTCLPKTQLIGVDEEDQEVQVDSDPANGIRLDVKSMPICVTTSKIGAHIVSDPMLEEELCASSQLCVAVDSKGCVYGMKKLGKGSLVQKEMELMIDVARKTALNVFESLDKVLMDQARRDYSVSSFNKEKIGFFG